MTHFHLFVQTLVKQKKVVLFLYYILIVRGRLYILVKKVFFDFAIKSCSIGAPDIPKNFAKRSEIKKMVF